MSEVVRRLLEEERLEEVASDATASHRLMDDARRHLEAARRIADLDRNGAYQLLYDAVRKAIAAHITAAGYRVTSRPGAHVAFGEYASAGLLSSGDVARFNRVRRNRNRSEYGVAHFDAHVVEAELAWAQHVVESLAERLD